MLHRERWLELPGYGVLASCPRTYGLGGSIYAGSDEEFIRMLREQTGLVLTPETRSIEMLTLETLNWRCGESTVLAQQSRRRVQSGETSAVDPESSAFATLWRVMPQSHSS